MKQDLRNKAIRLRLKGLSYSEIIKQIPVARSTLSLWLRSINLSQRQKQRLTNKKIESIKRGWEACRKKRILKIINIRNKALADTSNIKINKTSLWIMGTMLYWAEGSKEKTDNNISQGVFFCNSDPLMIKMFLKWLKISLIIPNERLIFQIYIHENYREKISDIADYWSEVTGFSMEKFGKIYFKKHNPKTIRKNQGNNYFGLIRIGVRKSTDLNRQISGWIEGICKKWGVV